MHFTLVVAIFAVIALLITIHICGDPDEDDET